MEGGPADTWTSHFQPPELGENRSCCFAPPGFPSFVKAATDTHTGGGHPSHLDAGSGETDPGVGQSLQGQTRNN